MLKIDVRNGKATIATRRHFNNIEELSEAVAENIFKIFKLHKITKFNYFVYDENGDEDNNEKIEVEWTPKDLSEKIKIASRFVWFDVNKEIFGSLTINDEKVIFDNIFPDEISTKKLDINEIIFI